MHGLYIDCCEDKVNIITLRGKSLIHRQIERRDGKTFMRLKKRAV